MTITIYHNPRCQTSRNVLAYLRDAGHEPRIIEYLKTPPARAELKRLVKSMGGKMRDVVRWKEPIAGQLGLDREKSSENDLLDAMMEHPILINRPIVVTENAVKLCRPSESVKEIV
ncbi:MAG TPA: arsenate reductase (glutaredoxin) [Micropepsaceae bacterium]|nr:arsenate reductase (glutaredoxin) [Micropepsaceae bacterium]